MKTYALYTGLGILVIGVLFFGGGYVFQISHDKTIYPAVYAGTQDIGSTSFYEALEKLQTYAQETHTTPISFTLEDTSKTLTLQDLGITLDAEQTLIDSYRTKRSSGHLPNPIKIFQETTIDWHLNIDKNQLYSTLEEEFVGQLPQPQEATFTLDDGTLSIEDSRSGKQLNVDALKEKIQTTLHTSDRIESLSLATTEQKPDVTSQDLEKLAPQVQKVLTSHTITLKENQDLSWDISPQEIFSLLSINPSHSDITIDTDNAQDLLQSFEQEINQDPQDAQVFFNEKTKKLNVLKSSTLGRTLNTEKSASLLAENILATKDQTFLEVETTTADIHEDNLDSLGITEKISQGSSNFAGSSSSRIHNIKTNAQTMSNTILAPGEEFSFVELMGPVNAANGYKPELVIKGDKTIPEYGGGICQVSSTIFRAVINSPLEITERHAHSYVVEYYGTPGLDATIYTPKPDFRFKNTSDNHILLQHSLEGTKLTYKIFGTSSDKKVTVQDPIILDSNPDGSMRTVVHQDIFRDGERIDRNSYYSTYGPPHNTESNPLE